MRYATKALCAVAVLCTLFVPAKAWAQQEDAEQVSAAGLTVIPAILEVAGKPGETVKKEFYIQNISSTLMPTAVTVDRLLPNEPELDPGASESFNASQWIKIDEPHHILQLQERRKVTATITVPQNAEPGGHYATIVWQPLAPATVSDKNTAKIAPLVGILVFITVSGDATYDVVLSNNMGGLRWSKNIPINAEFANVGTIHILPTAKVTIRNIFGHTKTELPLKPGIVLPNTRKTFSATWDKPALLGIYTVETTATYGPNHILIKGGKRYIVVVQWLPLILLGPLLAAALVFILKTYKRWPAAWRAFSGRNYIP